MGYAQILPLLGCDPLGRETVGKFIKEKGTLFELSISLRLVGRQIHHSSTGPQGLP